MCLYVYLHTHVIYQIGPKSSVHVNREGIDGVTGGEAADGVEVCAKVTRRQIGAGADWIKVRFVYISSRCPNLDDVSE